jgi:hypothetical protein
MPALAIAAELRRQRPDLEPVLVGAERGIEKTLLPTRKYRHVLLPAEPRRRRTARREVASLSSRRPAGSSIVSPSWAQRLRLPPVPGLTRHPTRDPERDASRTRHGLLSSRVSFISAPRGQAHLHGV